MNEQANIELVKQCYDAFLKGDSEKLLSHMAQDIVWDLPEVPGIGFSGKRQGRDNVAKFFEEVAQAQEVRTFEPREFFANGDKVVVLGHYDWTIVKSGVPFSSDWVHIFTVRNGSVVEFREMLDTYEAMECYRQSDPAARTSSASAGTARPLHH